MPQLAQARTRRACTVLTPAEHLQLMHVCKLSGKSVSDLLYAGLRRVLQHHLRYHGADPARLRAVGGLQRQRRATSESTPAKSNTLPAAPSER